MTTLDGEVRVGLIGAGYIGQIHSAGYRSVAGTFPDLGVRPRLTAIVDSDVERANRFAADWGWQLADSDWKRITRGDDIDVVDIAVPNALHAEIAIDAFEHGKHVICEKPLGVDVAAARAMVEAAERAERVNEVCFFYRLWPPVAWAIKAVAEGAIGEVRHFRGTALMDYAADPSLDLGWRARATDAGSGAVGDNGSHIFDIARAFCGDFKRVMAVTTSTVDRGAEEGRMLDDFASAIVHFEGGATGTIETGWASLGHKADLAFDVVGDRGAIRFSWERSNEIEVLEGGAEQGAGFRRVLLGGSHPHAANFVAIPGQGLGYRDAFTIGLAQGLAQIAEVPDAAPPTFADGLAMNQVVAGVLLSGEEERWVDVG